MKYYKVRGYSSYTLQAEIEEVEVERETDKSVWVKGNRYLKRSEWSNFYKRREEAKGHILKMQTEIRNRLKDRLADAEIALRKIKQL